MQIHSKKIGKKNNSSNITEIDENGKKKRKTKNQYVTLLTEFPAKWASTEGRLFHCTSKK